MNVTIKIDDSLCKDARHRAVDEGLSLSSWIALLLRKELASKNPASESLLESLAMEEGEDRYFELSRDDSRVRDLNFS
jgi:hypothetical protein